MMVLAEDLRVGDVMILSGARVEALSVCFDPNVDRHVEVHVDLAEYGWEYTTFAPRTEIQIEPRFVAP